MRILQAMQDHILIVDFGSQYTQLIARRVRELSVYAQIKPYHMISSPDLAACAGVILSGGPCSVLDRDAPSIDFSLFQDVPVLGVCYGAQLIAQHYGARIAVSQHREYGKMGLRLERSAGDLFQGLPPRFEVWMSHGDAITEFPQNLQVQAHTEGGVCAAYKIADKPIYGVQFHPEVYHTQKGMELLDNFLTSICKAPKSWLPEEFVSKTIAEIKAQVPSNQKVIIALSGGVDSSVAAVLVHRAIGDRLQGIFVNNGLLREGEYEQVLEQYRELGLPVRGVDVADIFFENLSGITEPEDKRKVIGKTFIEVFETESTGLGADWLVQGTIYPDVIESASLGSDGKPQHIKSHHNVGGLPKRMKFSIIEPLRLLFKDEVRKVGRVLGLPDHHLNRHPFPGPGLAIRILGAVSQERAEILRKADAIFINHLRQSGLYDQVWQAGVVLLPVYAVGVMGDQRTYQQVVALRAVSSTDGMTADWFDFPKSFLEKVSNEIINRVEGVNRVVYDISSKPPATIEWE